MNIEDLEKRIIELDGEMQAVVKEVGEELGKLESVEKKDKRYRELHDIMGHFVYIHYLLNDRKL